MGAPVIQPSFAAGELGPSLYGRVDLAKYHIGLAKARNVFVDYRGGVSNRSGTEFVGRCVDSSKPNRTIPFSFSSTQSYALIFGDHTMRILFRGAELLEQPFTIASASNEVGMHLVVPSSNLANGDEVTITAAPGMPEIEGRNVKVSAFDGVSTFVPLDLFGNAIDSTGFGTYTGAGTVARVYTITTPYAAADLALLKWTQSADTMTLVHPAYRPQKLTRNADATWSIALIEFSPEGDAPTNLIGVASDTTTLADTTYQYVVTAIGANGVTESRPSNVCTIVSTTMSITACFITLAWVGVPGATAYNVYRTAENAHTAPPAGALFGFVGTVTSQPKNTFVDANIKPDFSNAPPQPSNPFQIGAIQSIPVTAPGAGYTTAAIITITDPTGYGAVATPILDGSGAVTGVAILNGGQNYSAPVATISDTGAGAGGPLDPGNPAGGLPPPAPAPAPVSGPIPFNPPEAN